jgi:hypothetical protein
MAKRTKSRKDSVSLSKNAFIGLILFIVASTIFMVYAYMNFAVAR